MPFVPATDKKNLMELTDQPGKTLALIVPEFEDIEKLVELAQVSNPGHLAALKKFFFAKADHEFVEDLVRQKLDHGQTYLVFFNNKNSKKVKFGLN